MQKLSDLIMHVTGGYAAHVVQLAIPCLGGALVTAIAGLIYYLNGWFQ